MNTSAMTSRERIIAAAARRPVDHAPCRIAFNELTPAQRKGHAWRFPWRPDAPAEEKLRYQVETLGLDQVVPIGVNLCRPAQGVEAKTWIERGVLHKAYITPRGELHAAVRYNELWPHGEDIPFFSDFNIGHFVEPWIQNEADLECFKQVRRLCDTREVLDAARERAAASKALADRYGLATAAQVGMGLTGAMHLFGSAELCLMVVDEPGLVDAYLEHEHQINLRAIEVAGELGADIIWRNGFYETADFYGPAMLERFLGDRLRREADAAHSAGMLMNYTVHTGVMPILDYLAGLTMDSLFGIDIAFEGVDLRAVRDKLTPTKSLWIGPSSTYHLWRGPAATRQAVRDVFDAFAGTSFVLSPGVSAHSIMPWESTLAMIDEWKRLR